MEDIYNEKFATYEYGKGFSKERYIRDRISHPQDKEVRARRLQPDWGGAYACIWAPSKPYSLNQTVAVGECEPSWFTCSCKSNINQTFTNGGGMMPGVRIAIFAEIRHLIEALITFLSIFLTMKMNQFDS